MFNTIHPILFISVSGKAYDLFNNLSIDLGNRNTAQFKERYFRHVWIDENFQIRSSIDESITGLPIQDPKNKAENLKIVNTNRNLIKAILERQINSIYNLENTSYATENSLKIGAPQIVILAEIDNPVLAPIIIPIIQNIDFDAIKNTSADYSLNPQVHLFLMYNTNERENDTRIESKINKYAFLSDIESTNFAIKPYIWLLDNVNEQSIYIDTEQTIGVSICRFIELLFTNASDLISSTYNDQVTDDGEPCLYSTFGYASLIYPKFKIKDYLLQYVYEKELNLISKEFESKYETITIKDEATRFFQHPVLKDLSKNLSVNERTENIFSPYKFNVEKYIADEKDKTIDRPLSLIENPDTISRVSTSDLLHQISNTKEKYSDEVILEFSQQLEFAKKRELDLAKAHIDDTSTRLLDTKGCGVNYAILFTAVLANNKPVVESMLEGRFTSDVPNFSNFQENFRSLFIGDQIKDAQKNLKEFSDKVSNNIKLIQQYTTEKANSEKTVETLVSKSDESNPKLIELNTKIDNYTTQIHNLSIENEGLNLEIVNTTLFIETKRNEFDQDPTKESFKIERTKKSKEEIADLREKVFPAIDNELSAQYNQKNQLIEKRKKFIFLNLLLIPVLTAIFLTILSFFLYFKIHSDNKLLLNSFEISAVILCIYYIIQLIKFNKLKKSFNEVIYAIEQKLEFKKNRFLHYVSLINECFQKDFEFERDLISFNLVTPLIQYSLQKQFELTSFKEYIVKAYSNYHLQLEQFHFESNAFDFCVIDKADVSKIYDNSYQLPLIGSGPSNTIKLSKVYNHYEESNNIDFLLDSFTLIVDDLFKRKVETETLSEIIFAESKIYQKVAKPEVFFQKLYGTSRPLLKTERINSDIPYCHDITVGYLHEGYNDYLKNLNINNSLKIDSGNKDLFGLISIKSNIPSKIIYDMGDFRTTLSELINDGNKQMYFVNDNSYNHALRRTSSVDKAVSDNSSIPELLIFALTRGDIKFISGKNQFINDDLGSLGDNWNQLVQSWNSHLCHDLRGQLDTKFKDMLSVYETKDYQELSIRFIQSMLSINSVTSKDLDDGLSVFYFSILKGTEAGWKDVQSHFKEVKKKSI
jgi:hypothetical protein